MTNKTSEQSSFRIPRIMGVVLNRKPLVMDPSDEIICFEGIALLGSNASLLLSSDDCSRIISLFEEIVTFFTSFHSLLRYVLSPLECLQLRQKDTLRYLMCYVPVHHFVGLPRLRSQTSLRSLRT